jgi:hypothetical protein
MISVLLVAACGSDGSSDPVGEEDRASTSAPPSTPSAPADLGEALETQPSPASTDDQQADVADIGSDDSPEINGANLPTALAVSPDGDLYIASEVGVARRDGEGHWEMIDVDALPVGHRVDSMPGRYIDLLAVAPDGTLWAAGTAHSDVDDDEFGGFVDRIFNSRILSWIAAYDCASVRCSWEVVTSNDEPVLVGGTGAQNWPLTLGDLEIADDGSVYAPVDGPALLRFDGDEWTTHPVQGFDQSAWPWSRSIAITSDGTVWAGTDPEQGLGVISFDGTNFTRHTVDNGLPARNVFQVAAAGDGTLWAATDMLYDNPDTARPDAAEGVLHFDGTTWRAFTMDDGLLSNDAVVVTGGDSVWALHYEIPPYGYSSYENGTWTPHRTDEMMSFNFSAVMASDGTLWAIDYSDGSLTSFDGTTTTTHSTPFTDEPD